jgi:hypothetical protein
MIATRFANDRQSGLPLYAVSNLSFGVPFSCRLRSDVDQERNSGSDGTLLEPGALIRTSGQTITDPVLVGIFISPASYLEQYRRTSMPFATPARRCSALCTWSDERRFEVRECCLSHCGGDAHLITVDDINSTWDLLQMRRVSAHPPCNRGALCALLAPPLRAKSSSATRARSASTRTSSSSVRCISTRTILHRSASSGRLCRPSSGS